MSWNVPKGGNGNGDGSPRELCPPDEYAAVAVALVDLGHQQQRDFKDPSKQTWKPQCAVVFEVQGAKDSKGEPFYFAERYTVSTGELSRLRGLMTMAGLPEIEDDIEKVLGKPFLVTVEVAESSKGNEYSRLAKGGVAKLPKALARTVVQPVRPPFAWRLGNGLDELRAYNWLPYLYGKPLLEVVQQSREAQGEAPAPTRSQPTARQPDAVPAGVRPEGWQHAQESDPNDPPF